MVSLEGRDSPDDGRPEPTVSASATASASASASAKFLWGNWRVLAGGLRDRVERAAGGLPSLVRRGPRGTPLRVEEYAAEGARVVRVELPGIDPDNDIEISVGNGLLHIRAERRADEQASKASFRSEFRYGTFARTVLLPPGATGENIGAEYKDGILQLRVPDGEQLSQGPRIAITRG